MEKLSRKMVWLCIAFLLQTKTVSASHDLGGDFSYQYISPLTYLVKYHFYRDCAGVPAPTMLTICVSSVQLNNSFNANLLLTGPSVFLPNNYCTPAVITSCMGGTAMGIEELIFEGLVVLPAAASDWHFSYSDCCRSSTLFFAGNGILVYSGLDNSNSLINSSPVFNQQPVPQFCIGMQANYDFSCTDPDGDSLVYSLIPASDGSTCPATVMPLVYSSPYSYTNFINSSTPILLDSQTGMLSFTPSSIMTAVVCVRVDEYRNGQLIGFVFRDAGFTSTTGTIFYNLIKGRVFLDNNLNYYWDNGDRVLPDLIVETNPGQLYTSAGANGKYTAVVTDTGYFTLHLPFVKNYYNVIQNSQAAYFNTFGNIDTANDFIIQPVPGIKDLSVTMTRIASWGNFNRYYMMYRNSGTDTLSGNIILSPDSGQYYNSADPPATVLQLDTFSWSFNALLPLEKRGISVTFFNSLQGTIMPVEYDVRIEPIINDTFPADNEFTLHDTLLAPFDPNYKEVFPYNDLSLSEVQSQRDIVYTIHFQNTGTDTAVNVVIIDELDSRLFIPSMQITGSSHACLLSVDSAQKVNFSFPGIMLPDSGTDYPGSCGFVQFMIKPYSYLLPGDSITNEANIYFDNNTPVLTNKTVNRIVTSTGMVSLPFINDLKINYNHTDNSIYFSGDGISGALDVFIYDPSGRLLRRERISKLPEAVFAGDLSPGVYLVSAMSNGSYHIQKIFLSGNR